MNDDATPLVPERSVPVSGFSRELRQSADVVRVRFDFELGGGTWMPVHIVFSPAQQTAEVKSGDMKALRLLGVASVEEARTRWVAWWGAGSRKPSFRAPRRTGRSYVAAHARP